MIYILLIKFGLSLPIITDLLIYVSSLINAKYLLYLLKYVTD